MSPKPTMTYGVEVHFIYDEPNVYMLRPYYRENYNVSYGVWIQNVYGGFEKACCISCLSDDYVEDVIIKIENAIMDNYDYKYDWEEAEKVWREIIYV